jgi:hypothetical protein
MKVMLLILILATGSKSVNAVLKLLTVREDANVAGIAPCKASKIGKNCAWHEFVSVILTFPLL